MFLKNIKKFLIRAKLEPCTIVLCLVLCVANTAFAAEPTVGQVRQIEQKRTEAKQKIRHLKLLERIETNKLYRNQQKLEQTAQDLQQSRQQYVYTEKEVLELKAQLEAMKAAYYAQRAATNRRIVQIFKTQRKSYIEFLFSARDLNNFLDRLYFENIIMKKDEQRLRDTQIKTRRIRELQAKMESQQSYLQLSIKSINRQQKNIQSAIEQNEKLIEKLKNDRATWERSERELARQSEAIAEMINKTVAQEKGAAIVVTGGFMRPCNGSITSPYGYRVHPIFKRTIFHSGLDIAAPMNTPVRVANSGKVIFSGWYGGYGKVVIVDHGTISGKPTTTLYAHLNRYLVDVGNSVVKGQVIGNVGTTGYSTGPHLHFEVRVSGKTTNPLNYVRY